MLLKNKANDHMVDVVNFDDLINLNLDEIYVRYQEGEEQQDPERINKANLVFLSGEALPRCWTDSHYRDNEIRR